MNLDAFQLVGEPAIKAFHHLLLAGKRVSAFRAGLQTYTLNDLSFSKHGPS